MFELWRSAGVVLARGAGYGHRFPRHWHDELHVCVYTGGRGYLRARGETRQIATNSVVVTPPGEVHENWAEGGVSFIGAYFAGEVGWSYDDPAIAPARGR